jgi:pimeloyl-ACP methyl ester carboxylesterase
MPEFTRSIVSTPRLDINLWSSGPEDGVPLLLLHGNMSSGGFWRYLAAELPDHLRVLAPDLRGFGRTEPKTIDATRGLGDMADDIHGLLETLGLAGQGRVNAVGWSTGAGVLEQLLIEHPTDQASLTLVAPMSPYGYGGTKDVTGTPTYSDFAASGGGGANPEFVRRMADKDDTEMMPPTSPRTIFRTFFGAGSNAANVDEDFLVEELLRMRTGPDFYPGDSVMSTNWPLTAPGARGLLNAISPKYFNTSGIVDVNPKPPITWISGGKDQVVSNQSMFDFGTLGLLGLVPGWPGPTVAPPQPMEEQTRAVLQAYAEAGGRVREVRLAETAHGIPLEAPRRLAEELVAGLVC